MRGCGFISYETYFLIDPNYGQRLALESDTTVEFADIVTGNEGITMIVLLGGCLNAHLEISMLIF